MFGSVKCKICVKPVYRMDPLINLDGSIIHKQCAKCGDCNCQITLSNFVKSEIGDQTTLLCKIHYLKRFAEGVGYPGEEKYKMKSAQSSPATTPIISRVVNEERFPSRKHLKHVSNSVVGESSPPEDTVLLKRADSSPSVAVDFSTDQWENTHKLLLVSEDGDPITSETTSVSTIESDASSAQVSPMSISGRQSMIPDFQQPRMEPEDGFSTPKGNPGAEPGTVKSFLKLYSGSGKVPLPSSSAMKSMSAKRDNDPPTSDDGSTVIVKSEGRPLSWRSSSAAGEQTNGTKSVLSRYAHNAPSDKASTPLSRAESRPTSSSVPSWRKQSIEAE